MQALIDAVGKRLAHGRGTQLAGQAIGLVSGLQETPGLDATDRSRAVIGFFHAAVADGELGVQAAVALVGRRDPGAEGGLGLGVSGHRASLYPPGLAALHRAARDGHPVDHLPMPVDVAHADRQYFRHSKPCPHPRINLAL
jgi:hypothetical protein